MRGAAVVLLLGAVAADSDNETACRALGFAPSLLCSSCAKLGEYVGEEDALVGECKSCCAEDASNAGAVYPRAVLDICR